jgi:hypothetical protein
LVVDLARSTEFSHPARDDHLVTDNLRLLQYFHLHTAQQMSLHTKRNQVWQRVIPDPAVNNPYLMHLLLALSGIHMTTDRLKLGPAAESKGSIGMVDLQVVVEHHQRGLQAFREEVSRLSNANAEVVYAGSLLLVGFIYASLQVNELNPPGVVSVDRGFHKELVPIN